MCYNNRGAIIGEEILSPLLQASLVTCAKLLFAVQRQRNFEGLPSRRKAAPGFIRSDTAFRRDIAFVGCSLFYIPPNFPGFCRCGLGL